MERRFLPIDECPVSIEKRDDGEEQKIVGRAAVFYDGSEETEYKLFDEIVDERGNVIQPALVERLSPKAFNKALKERQDVRALFNHDPNLVLGRTASGTLKLEKSQRGLDYKITPGKTTVASDVKEHINRGDVTGSSFGFRVVDQKFSHDKERNVDVRELRSVDLLDVSPVTYPAYTSTNVGMRAAGDVEEARSAYAEWQAGESQQAEANAKLTEKLKDIQKRAQEVEC
jgi:HK97 family phage prohead protease